jgi:hypothetical protein
MKIVNGLITLWNQHGTKLLGSGTGLLSGFLAIPGLISAPHVKYWAATNVVLSIITVNRGYVNSKNLAKDHEAGDAA